MLVMTAYGSVELAVEAMKTGRLRLPPQALRRRRGAPRGAQGGGARAAPREVGRLRREVRAEARFGEIVARSRAMAGRWRWRGRWLATTPPSSSAAPAERGRSWWPASSTVRATGPTAPFMPVNCGGIPETPAGVRVLRLHEGRVHRRGPGQARPVRGGRRGHALPGRGGRAPAAAPGEAPAVAAGGRGAPGGRHARPSGWTCA